MTKLCIKIFVEADSAIESSLSYRVSSEEVPSFGSA